MRLKEVNNSKIISKGQKRVLNKEKILCQTEPEDDEHRSVPVEVIIQQHCLLHFLLHPYQEIASR